MLPLEPFYALRYLVLFLVVVAVGGHGSFKGSFVAALTLGIIDTAGKFLLPEISAFILFGLVLRAAAVAAERDAPAEGRHMTELTTQTPAQHRLRERNGSALLWHFLPWAIAIVFFYLAGGYLSLGTSTLVMILLTLSLDLALGYAGIITLGHAAFFGFGAYSAALFALHVNTDPLTRPPGRDRRSPRFSRSRPAC